MCASHLRWRTSENLWQRRASGVAFVNLAKHGDENFYGFVEMLLDSCEATVQHLERFSQIGTGWVLRELSIAEPERVEAFIRGHICEFSREGLRYAADRLLPASKETFKSMRAQCRSKSRGLPAVVQASRA